MYSYTEYSYRGRPKVVEKSKGWSKTSNLQKGFWRTLSEEQIIWTIQVLTFFKDLKSLEVIKVMKFRMNRKVLTSKLLSRVRFN